VVISRVGGFSEAGAYVSGLAIVTPVFLLLGISARQIFVSGATATSYPDFVRLRLLGGIVGTGVAWGITTVFFTHLTVIVLGLSLLKIAETLIDLQVARFQKGYKHLNIAVLTVLNSVICFGSLALTFVATTNLEVSIFIGGTGSAALALALEVWFTTRAKRPKLCRPISDFGPTLRAGFTLSGSTFLVSLSTSIPVLVLSKFDGSEAAGVYAALFNFSTVANTIFSTLAQYSLRRFSLSAEEGNIISFVNFRKKIMLSVLLSGLLLSGLIAFWGLSVFEIVFGEPLAPFEAALAPVALLVLISGFGFTTDSQLISLKLHRFQLNFALVVLVVSAIVHPVFIYYFGLTGAFSALTGIALLRVVLREVRVRRELNELLFSARESNS
jgi:O-antigen/teichoic acid export membrane protein